MKNYKEELYEKYKEYKKEHPVFTLFYLSFFIGVILTLYIWLKKDSLKEPEKYLSNSKLILLYSIRLFHLFTTIFAKLYIFIVPYHFTYDLIFIIIYIIKTTLFHIYYKNECYFSVIEKQILNPNYVAGKDGFCEIFLMLLFPEFKNRKLVMNIVHHSTSIFVGYIILYRFTKSLYRFMV